MHHTYHGVTCVTLLCDTVKYHVQVVFIMCVPYCIHIVNVQMSIFVWLAKFFL